MYNMTSRYAQVRGKYQYWYGTDPQSGRIEPLANGNAESDNSLVLDNAVEGGSTGLVSIPMRNCGGCRYVILGRIKDNGQGRNGFAIAWYSRTEYKIQWANVAPKTSLPEWTPVAGVVQVPDEGDWCKVWLMNWSESGCSFFDDVLVFELPALPGEYDHDASKAGS